MTDRDAAHGPRGEARDPDGDRGDGGRAPSDHELLSALGAHESIGERYLRTGEIPISTARQPAMEPSPGSTMERDPTPVKPIPKPPRSIGRIVVRAVLAVVALAAIYFLVTLWQVWSTGRADQTRAVDAIVVMGAAQYNGRPSPQLEARLDHAVELWNQGITDTVIVTGGNQPGDQYTEAEASSRYLVERNVPADVIRQEDAGTSTYESLSFVRRDEPDVQSVLLVTDPYHSLRTRMVAAEVGFDAFVSPTPASVVTGTNQFRREVEEAAGIAVGRIIGFDRLDDLTD